MHVPGLEFQHIARRVCHSQICCFAEGPKKCNRINVL